MANVPLPPATGPACPRCLFLAFPEVFLRFSSLPGGKCPSAAGHRPSMPAVPFPSFSSGFPEVFLTSRWLVTDSAWPPARGAREAFSLLFPRFPSLPGGKCHITPATGPWCPGSLFLAFYLSPRPTLCFIAYVGKRRNVRFTSARAPLCAS